MPKTFYIGIKLAALKLYSSTDLFIYLSSSGDLQPSTAIVNQLLGKSV